MNEKDFMQSIIDLARKLNWMVYHTWNSIHSAKGFPDLVLVRRKRTIFIECKSDKGVLTEAQNDWLKALSEADNEVYVFRPSDVEECADILLRDVPPNRYEVKELII